MSLDKYLENLDAVLQNPWILIVQCQKEKRSATMGLITGKVVFVDNSELHFMEYVEVAGQVKCQTYRYHYQDKTKKLIFRYDNAPHHPETPTHPYHKHVGSEILQSRQPALGEVMDEILQQYLLAVLARGPANPGASP